MKVVALERLQSIIDYCTELLTHGGIFFGVFLVFLECFIPMLPLSIFVAFNVEAFGFFIGSIISWMGTCIGSILCYVIFYHLGDKVQYWSFFQKIVQKIHIFQKISFTHLVLILTLPFTPSFAINILSGVSKVSIEKFLLSLLIGKMFTIVFWGYIGISLFHSLTDIRSLIYIGFTLIIAYLISKGISKYMNIE